MGSWNGTCGLTNLPILYGEDVYVFPIVENQGSSFCHSNALYRPTAIPFRAVYNDYGGCADSHGAGIDIIMGWICENLVEMEVGENQFHDIAVKKKLFNSNTFFDACHEKRLKFVNPMKHFYPDRPYNNVLFAMIRKDVVDRLWDEWVFDMFKPYGIKHIPEEVETSEYYLKNMSYAKFAEYIPDYMEYYNNLSLKSNNNMSSSIQKAFEDSVKNGMITEEEYQKYVNEDRFFNGNSDHLLSSIFNHIFCSGYSDGGFSRIENLKENIIHEYMNGDKELAFGLLQECLIGYMINDFMNHTRKVWLPVMHQGDQSECYDEHTLLNNVTNDIIQTIK